MIRIRERLIADKNLISDIAHTLNVSHRLAEMLFCRGYDSTEKAQSFLNPSLNDIYDPFALGGMRDAVERISLAKQNNETVLIYGDYDADGISAVSILYRSLKIFGIDAITVIPEREDGYGLSDGVLSPFLEEYFPDLLITVDCGISAVKEVEQLKDLGVDVIVTDHHEIPDQIPDCTVINCKLNGYPFDGLCGAGVAYKLSKALIGDKANDFLDLVAVATVADSMPLVSENRILVNEGLERIKNGKCCKIIKAISAISGLKEVTSTSLAYTIAPRINAAGRMDNANLALRAFISDDIQEIEALAKVLNDFNVKRQSECEGLYKTAKAMLSSKSPNNRVIALYSSEWKTGLIGIVAAKLVEEYSKPVILFAEKDGVLHGSARSVAGVNIFKALSSVKSLVDDYGGHAQAAGVTLTADRFELFENTLNEYLVNNCDVSDFIQETEVEELIDERFTVEFAKEISLLEPFGVGNKKPVFALKCDRAYASPLKIGSPHVAFKTDYLELLMFNGVESLSVLNSEMTKLIVFEPNISIFNGRESLKGYVKEIVTVCTDNKSVESAVLSAQLDAINDNGSYQPINSAQAECLLEKAKKDIYGTLFIVSDFQTFDKFKLTQSFNKSVLVASKKGNINLVTLGTDGFIPQGYDTVVYLDKPLSVVKTHATVYVNEEIDGFSKVGLSADRAELGKVYLAVRNRPQGYLSASEISEDTGVNVRQVVFALRVFIELGLIIPQGGRYKAVLGIKRDLADSSVYRSIKRILG